MPRTSMYLVCLVSGMYSIDFVVLLKVVASKDWPKVSGLYSARVRTQPSKMEMIEGLYEEVDGQRGGMVK